MSMMNPLAGPSGPGDKSTRTDLPPSKEYGERKQTKEYIQGATLAKTRGIADNVGGRLANPVAQTPVTPLYAPTEKPGQSVTAGVDTGPDVGSSALMMQSQFANRKLSDILVEMIPYDTTGEIQYLYQNALSRGQ